eukprot:Hpha_TRINITY_DN15934_c1_g6::TRINITY_DN15934_c1_g6_i1::g.73653::m.73653
MEFSPPPRMACARPMLSRAPPGLGRRPETGGGEGEVPKVYEATLTATTVKFDLGGESEQADIVIEAPALAKAMEVSSPWGDRIEALQRLQRIMRGGAGTQPEVASAFSALMGPLTACVRDLRSQVVREACAAVQVLCAYTPAAQWAPFTGTVLKSLQHQFPCAKHVMADSANEAARFLVQTNRVDASGVKVLCDGAEHRSKSTRARSLEHIFRLVRQEFGRGWEKVKERVLSVVVKGLGDADPTVRAMARLAAATLGVTPSSEAQSKQIAEAAAATTQLEEAGTLPPPRVASTRASTRVSRTRTPMRDCTPSEINANARFSVGGKNSESPLPKRMRLPGPSSPWTPRAGSAPAP